jgi:hypothetical protein
MEGDAATKYSPTFVFLKPLGPLAKIEDNNDVLLDTFPAVIDCPEMGV